MRQRRASEAAAEMTACVFLELNVNVDDITS